MGFLKAIDIRGNPVGDEGVLKIVNAIPLLKSLCISETKAGDHSGKAIAEGIKDL